MQYSMPSVINEGFGDEKLFNKQMPEKEMSIDNVSTNLLINNLYTNSCSDSIKSYHDNSSFYNNEDKYKPLEEINSIYNFSDLQNNINNCGFNPSNISEDKINNGYNDQELKKFNQDLYETMDNIYEKKNFERQFNTIQNRTNPTNESMARKWIYATPITCKETSAQCFEYEDLSRKRSPII